MKHKFLSGIVLSTVILTNGLTANASATTTETETEGQAVSIEVGAGIAPGSFLYKLDKAIENLRLNIASEDKEAQLLLQFAEERLAELNKLDEEDLEKYADQLYEEYGVNLEKVSEKVAEEIAKGKVNAKLEKMKEKLDRAATLDQDVDAEKVTSVSEELKVKVNNAQTKTYALSIVTNLEQTQVEALKTQGFGYGDIIKLQAFAEISGKTIEELTFLDIYETSEDGKKEVDFEKLALELGLVIENENGEVKADLNAVKEQFEQYKDAVKKIQKELKDSAKEEIEKHKEEARREFSEKVDAKLQERLVEFNTKIDEIYNAKVEIINNLDETTISAEQKAALLVKLDEIKVELIAKVSEKVTEGKLEPRDLGKLNAEIHKEFNELFEDILTEEEQELLEAELGDIVNQARPIFNHIIEKYQEKNELTLSVEQVELIWAEVEQLINEIDEDDKEDLLEELDEEVYDIIEELFEEQVTVNVDEVFNELLNSEFIKHRLDETNLEVFKQQLIEAKAEILAEVDTDKAFEVKMEIIEAFKDRLEAFLDENEVKNPHAQDIFNKIINSTLFKLSTRLDKETFETFKQQLIESRAEILAEIDLDESNAKIEIELYAELRDLLEEFKDAKDTDTEEETTDPVTEEETTDNPSDIA